MDAAKNITTTEIKCGTALGSSERKSMELMPRKLQRGGAPLDGREVNL